LLQLGKNFFYVGQTYIVPGFFCEEFLNLLPGCFGPARKTVHLV
jgi:hypothetical protein